MNRRLIRQVDSVLSQFSEFYLDRGNLLIYSSKFDNNRKYPFFSQMPLAKPYPPTEIDWRDWNDLADNYAGEGNRLHSRRWREGRLLDDPEGRRRASQHEYGGDPGQGRGVPS